MVKRLTTKTVASHQTKRILVLWPALSLPPAGRLPHGRLLLAGRLSRVEPRLELLQDSCLLEHFRRPPHDAGERLFSDVYGKSSLLCQAAVEAPQQSATTGKYDPGAHDVGNQLRRSDLYRLPHGLDDGVDGAREGVPQLDAAHFNRLRQPRRQVAALQLYRDLEPASIFTSSAVRSPMSMLWTCRA